MPAPAALEAKYGCLWRGMALRKKTRGFYVRAWQYQGLMKRMLDRIAAEALQQQMYEHYNANSEADKNKLRTWNRIWQYGNELKKKGDGGEERSVEMKKRKAKQNQNKMKKRQLRPAAAAAATTLE